MRMDCGCEHPELPGRLGALDVRVENIHDGCPATWSLLASGRTKGVFQLESRLGQTWVRRLRPTSLDHLAALVAILRPGVLDARDDQGVSATEHYCRRKNGEDEVTVYHPSVEEILSDTYGLVLYQEQSMSIAAKICGFDLKEVDWLRKGIGKKNQELISQIGDTFVRRGDEAGVAPPDVVRLLWDIIRESGRYAFNRAHSYSYGLRSLRTAYLKAHFPLVFFACWLSTAHYKGLKKENGSSVDEKQSLIDDARSFGVEVEPPDLTAVGQARRHFHPNQGRVRFGLGDVRGVGPGTLKELEDAADFAVAELGKPMDRLGWSECVFYFLYEVKTNVAQALVKAGAARMAPGRRAGLFQLEGAATAPTRLTPGELRAARAIVKADPGLSVEEVLRLVARPKKDGGGCATPARRDLLDGAATLMARPPHSLSDEPGWVAAAEEDVLGVPLTASRCDGVDGADARCADLADPRPGTYRVAVEVVSVRPTVTKKGKSPGSAMAQLTVRDLSGPLRLACFPDAWAQAKEIVKEGSVVLLEVEVWDRGDLCVSARRAWRARGV